MAGCEITRAFVNDPSQRAIAVGDDLEVTIRADELEAIAEHCARLPVLDARPAHEILGYDERGLPR